ncbi:MAG: selenide, water dikinase SelD [Hydrogenophilus sp.]|nr:selenide, water dikinase SelD [Hydrogenophilus sp.]
MVRLTELAHGGGCGCKIAPGVLERLLHGLPPGMAPPELLVGLEGADDAAVWQLNEHEALVATVDFFLPVVDDPYDFGRIAATNALSDVYAMGGRPILGLAVVGMPVQRLPEPVIARVLEGGADVCRAAGVALAGGHSIDCAEPFYGLVALGLVHPARVVRNSGAQPGDRLILTKPLGIGVLSAALKKGLLTGGEYTELLLWTTLLNRVGMVLAEEPGVHAMTDVTGFGLAGHALEMARASEVRIRLERGLLPLLPAAVRYARAGVQTGAAQRNWESYGRWVDLSAIPEEEQAFWRGVVTDPQTSGGLLVACAPEVEQQVLHVVRATQEFGGAVVGEVLPGPVGVTVE